MSLVRLRNVQHSYWILPIRMCIHLPGLLPRVLLSDLAALHWRAGRRVRQQVRDGHFLRWSGFGLCLLHGQPEMLRIVRVPYAVY
jgi:hypothetical protein